MSEDSSELTPAEAEARIAELEARIREFHRSELNRWAEATIESQRVWDELEAMRKTVSWRVTAPLRVVRRRQLGS